MIPMMNIIAWSHRAPWPEMRQVEQDLIISRAIVAIFSDEQCPDPSPEAFIFASRRGGLMDSSNYRKRVLHRLAEELELPKLTFQVIRRTIATLAQNIGPVKDVQGMMRHSRTATTTDVYMQELPEGVRATVNSIHDELESSNSPQRAASAITRKGTPGRESGKEEIWVGRGSGKGKRQKSKTLVREGFGICDKNATKSGEWGLAKCLI